MIILGVVLVVAALVALGFVALGAVDVANVRLEALGLAVETSPLVLFLAGAAVLLLAEIGMWFIRAGARRHGRTRSEIGRLRRVEAEVQAQQLQQAQREADARATATPTVADTPFGRRDTGSAAPAPGEKSASGPTAPVSTASGSAGATTGAASTTGDTQFGREPAVDPAGTDSEGRPSEPAARPADGGRR